MSIDSIQQLLDWHPPRQNPIIADGILLPETRLMVFGQAKSWKSILALHTAFCLATGSHWFGFETTKVTVLKYQAELPKAIDRDRVEKYAKGLNSYPPNIFFKTPSDRVKLDTTWGMSAINKDIEEVKSRSPGQPLVLILDPLYKLMAGHISDEYDAKKFQENIDDLKAKHSLSVVIIHHSRLSKTDSSGAIVDLGAEESMGSSYFNNWCDTMIRVKLLNPHSGSDDIGISFELSRNAQVILHNFKVHWDRTNLLPIVISQDPSEDPTIRGLKE